MYNLAEKAVYLHSKPFAKTCLTPDGFFHALLLS
jgi:hypothetical protein